MSLVRFQSEPPFAGLAHLVERHLAKVEVASSSLVTRSKIKRTPSGVLFILDLGNAGRFTEGKQQPCFYTKGEPAKVSLSHFPFLARGWGCGNGGASFLFWIWGTQGTLRRESSSPDFTRKGNPQRFPFHTFPSLREGGAAGMGGASFLFWSMGTHTPCGGKAAVLILRERGTRKVSPFTLFLPCEGGGAAGMDGASFLFWIWGTQGILRRGRPGCCYLFGGCHGILEVI